MEEKPHLLHQEPPSSSDPHLVRLHKILNSCSQFVGDGGVFEAGTFDTELAECLDPVSANSASDDEDVQRTSHAMLSVILDYVKSSSTAQEVVDALSFELPKAVCKFSAASRRYLAVVESIIDQLVLRCHPRDLIVVLCEALHYQTEQQINVCGYVSPLLSGIAKVLISIRRRHLEQLKVVVPLIFQALEQASLEEDEYIPLVDLFYRAIGIGSSIHEVSQKLEDESRKKLQALLALYTLQIMAYLSINIINNSQEYLHVAVLELTSMLQSCDLSYIELITGSAVDELSRIIAKGEEEEEEEGFTLSSFSYIKHGACLSVIWSRICNDISLSGKDAVHVVNELRCSQSKRWQAIGMLKYIFLSSNMPWTFKKQAIEIVHEITHGNPLQGFDNENSDIFFDSFSSIFAALQGIIMVVINSPTTELRREAFGALKQVLADIPASQRVDMLKALITNGSSPSMNALLLDCVREEMRKEIQQQPKDAGSPEKPFWTDAVTELISFILRPPNGGPPSLPEETDQVLSALNLYRYILITESTGKTNYTKVLSEANLKRAYKEWLLPLRNVVASLMARDKEEEEEEEESVVATLNPLEMVVYRCIELVEENLCVKL